AWRVRRRIMLGDVSCQNRRREGTIVAEGRPCDAPGDVHHEPENFDRRGRCARVSRVVPNVPCRDATELIVRTSAARGWRSAYTASTLIELPHASAVSEPSCGSRCGR